MEIDGLENDEIRAWLLHETKVPPLAAESVQRAALYKCTTQGPNGSVMENFLTQQVLMCPVIERARYTLGQNHGRERLFGLKVMEERTCFCTITGNPVYTRSMMLENGALVISQTSGPFVSGSSTMTTVNVIGTSGRTNARKLDMATLELDCNFCNMRGIACQCAREFRNRSMVVGSFSRISESFSAWDLFLRFIVVNSCGWGWVTPVTADRARLRMHTLMSRDGSAHHDLQIRTVQDYIQASLGPMARLLDTSSSLTNSDLEPRSEALSSPILSSGLHGQASSLKRRCKATVEEILDESTSHVEDDGAYLSRSEEYEEEDVRLMKHARVATNNSRKPRPAPPPSSATENERADSTGEADKPSKCSLCGVVLSRPYDRKRHVEIVHMKRRSYNCPFCPKTFGQKGHRNVHVRGVHGERNSFECHFCQKTFSWRHNYVRHMQKCHDVLAEDVPVDETSSVV